MGQFLSKTIPLCVKPVIASQGWNGQIYAISHMLKFRSCQTCQISTLSPSFSATHQRKHCSRKKSSRTTTIHSAQTYTQRRKRMDKPGGTLEYGRMAGQREHQKQELGKHVSNFLKCQYGLWASENIHNILSMNGLSE